MTLNSRQNPPFPEADDRWKGRVGLMPLVARLSYWQNPPLPACLTLWAEHEASHHNDNKP